MRPRVVPRPAQSYFYKLPKNRFIRKQFKKVCVLQRRACNKFKRNYLENYNNSEHAVKTKNGPFFMIFPNISFFHMVVNYSTGPLSHLCTNDKLIDRKKFFSDVFETTIETFSMLKYIGQIEILAEKNY